MIGLGVAWAVLSGCASDRPIELRGSASEHINTAAASVEPKEIPAPVTGRPLLPPPQAAERPETYTVVVNEVPVKELLFALSRDAAINVDVHPEILGVVTMSAIDQTLEQILARISRQVSIRYENRNGTLVISPDRPFLKAYRIDYVNLSRETKNTVSVSTQISNESIGGGQVSGADENNSTTEIESASDNQFWQTLQESVLALLQDPARGERLEVQAAEGRSNPYVIVNREAGVLVVRATSRQHEEIRRYLDQVRSSVRRQVLIQATIVEVTLSDRYQAGIDFDRLLSGGGRIASSLINGRIPAGGPFFVLNVANRPAADSANDTNLTVRLLKEFGDVRVLSSPTVMAINNQTAVFKVVDNRVFFTVEVETTQQLNVPPVTNVETTPHTVSVGLVMTVTPQIGQNDEVTMIVRPTITREFGNGIRDPNPALVAAGVVSIVPEIRVRELESVLRLHSGQIAVLGGLMQDNQQRDEDAIPLLGEIPVIGELFKFRDDNFVKTELVVFLKPTVVRSASIDGNLGEFRSKLPQNLGAASPQPSWGLGRTPSRDQK